MKDDRVMSKGAVKITRKRTKLNGEVIDIIKCFDDTILIADNNNVLQELIAKLCKLSTFQLTENYIQQIYVFRDVIEKSYYKSRQGMN